MTSPVEALPEWTSAAYFPQATRLQLSAFTTGGRQASCCSPKAGGSHAVPQETPISVVPVSRRMVPAFWYLSTSEQPSSSHAPPARKPPLAVKRLSRAPFPSSCRVPIGSRCCSFSCARDVSPVPVFIHARVVVRRSHLRDSGSAGGCITTFGGGRIHSCCPLVNSCCYSPLGVRAVPPASLIIHGG